MEQHTTPPPGEPRYFSDLLAELGATLVPAPNADPGPDPQTVEEALERASRILSGCPAGHDLTAAPADRLAFVLRTVDLAIGRACYLIDAARDLERGRAA